MEGEDPESETWWRKRQSGNQTLKEQEEDRKADERDIKAQNPQLEGEDPESEVIEENHERGKDGQGIRIGKCEVTHHKWRVLELELHGHQ